MKKLNFYIQVSNKIRLAADFITQASIASSLKREAARGSGYLFKCFENEMTGGK